MNNLKLRFLPNLRLALGVSGDDALKLSLLAYMS
jgi:hypothetical protein